MARSGVIGLAGVAFAALLAASCASDGAQQTPTPGPSSPTSVRPAGSPAGTLTAAPASAPEIAYVGPDSNDIWLVAADGTGKRTAALGFIVQGGTLTTPGLLFVNRCTWSHILEEAARLLRISRDELLTVEEQVALDGKASPEG